MTEEADPSSRGHERVGPEQGQPRERIRETVVSVYLKTMRFLINSNLSVALSS